MSRKTFISVSILLVIIGILLPIDITFAQNTTAQTATTTVGQGLENFLNLLISLLSRIRVLLATLAGKLMTNNIVYGEFIHLDTSLWKLWNVMRNFANFAIGFLFIRTIIKFVFSKDGEQPKELAKKIFGFIAGAIAVQMSRFLIGATIDLSTILTVSIGSFPSMILSQDNKLQQQVAKMMIQIPSSKLNLNNTTTENVLEQTKEMATNTKTIPLDNFLDLITPNNNTLAGPLLYMGVSVFKIQDYMHMTVNTPNTDLSDLIMTTLIKAGMLIFFTFALLLILIFNIIRVVFIWMFIALSPIIILFYILKEIAKIDIRDGKIDIGKGLDLTSAARLIFAPVLFVTYISLMFIMVVTMQRIIGSNENNGIFATDTVKVTGNSVEVKGIASFTLDGHFRDNYGEDVQTTISDILLMLVTLFMLWGLVYMIKETAKGDIGGNAVDETYKIGMKGLSNIPIGNTSVGAMQQVAKEYLTPDVLSEHLNTKIQEDVDSLKEMLPGQKNNGLKAKNKKAITEALRKDKWINNDNNALTTLSQNISEVQFTQGQNNFNTNTEVKGYADNRITGSYNGTNREFSYNRQKYLQRYDRSFRDTKGKTIKHEDVKDLSSFIDETLKKMTTNQKKQDFLQTLFQDLTGKSATITKKDQFMKQPFK